MMIIPIYYSKDRFFMTFKILSTDKLKLNSLLSLILDYIVFLKGIFLIIIWIVISLYGQ